MSSGNTAKGYPYPNGDDPVANGDNIATALANKLEAVVPFSMAAGSVVVAIALAANQAGAAVVFPAGRFSVPPIVTVAIAGSPTTHLWAGVQVAPTKDGFTAQVISRDSGQGALAAANVTVAWWAVQMTPTTAAG